MADEANLEDRIVQLSKVEAIRPILTLAGKAPVAPAFDIPRSPKDPDLEERARALRMRIR